jgi:RNA polymerase sigma factor (sigma-70 family)
VGGVDVHEEFDKFVRQHLPALGRYAYVLTSDREDAADLVQDVLVRLAKAWVRVDRAGNPLAYARTAMVRLYISGTRRANRWRTTAALLHATGTDITDGRFDELDEQIGMDVALRCLSPRQRAVIVLTYFDDADDQTIGRLMGRRPGAVRSLRHRALSSLRTMLDQSPTVDANERGGAR